jgi:hypothetical protein
MEERLPRLLPIWGQSPEQELLLQVLPSPRSPWTTGSANFFVAKREKRGVAQMMSPGERETIAVRPHYRPLSQDYGEQIPDSLGQQTMLDPTVGPDVTINLRN